jgi:serine/threonine protein phosphatase PrpC
MFKFDNASAISQGGRDYQEDAIVSDFSNGADIGFAVLSDGMGGHAAGDVASKIVVTEVFRELTFQRERIAANPAALAEILQNAALSANACLKNHMNAYPDTNGMGATLVACIVVRDQLHWISVGDSPLFLFRDNVLQQLNEDHSLGPHIDLMVQSGVITSEEGQNHPERNVLTSVLAGQTKLFQIDCPSKALLLKAGDTIIVASDGLQYLTNDSILQVLRDRPMARSADITDALMSKLHDLGDPDLDNVSMSLIQVRAAAHESATAHSRFRNGVGSDFTLRWPFVKREPIAAVARRARARTENRQGSSADGV